MASKEGETKLRVATTTTTNFIGGGGDNYFGNSPKGQASSVLGGGYCLCSPTKHKGSFRCKFHRSNNQTDQSSWFKRSISMPPLPSKNFCPISPDSVQSST